MDLSEGGYACDERLNVLTDHETTQGVHSFQSYATSLYDPKTAATGGVLAYTGSFADAWGDLRGREIYSRRMATVEPVFANLQNKGMRRFTRASLSASMISSMWYAASGTSEVPTR